ncbi:hypothetical protein Tco_0079532 [Tanacetum coccineum]
MFWILKTKAEKSESSLSSSKVMTLPRFVQVLTTPDIVTTPAVPATEDSPPVPEQTTVETVMNMTPENRAHFKSKKEAIHLILTGIGDEIYSNLLIAMQTAQEIGKHRKADNKVKSLNISRCQDKRILGDWSIHLSNDGETLSLNTQDSTR